MTIVVALSRWWFPCRVGSNKHSKNEKWLYQTYLQYLKSCSRNCKTIQKFRRSSAIGDLRFSVSAPENPGLRLMSCPPKSDLTSGSRKNRRRPPEDPEGSGLQWEAIVCTLYVWFAVTRSSCFQSSRLLEKGKCTIAWEEWKPDIRVECMQKADPVWLQLDD